MPGRFFKVFGLAAMSNEEFNEISGALRCTVEGPLGAGDLRMPSN
jgi:hypothetical protein